MLDCWAKYPPTVHKVSPNGVLVLGVILLIWFTALAKFAAATGT
jgi:hypothetical protein